MNAEQFSQLLACAINSTSSDRQLTEDEFDRLADSLRIMVSVNNASISDEVFESVCKRFKSQLEIIMPLGVVLVDESSQREKWVEQSEKPGRSYFFWNRYKRYLMERRCWSYRMVNTLDKVSSDILDLCGNPRQVDPFSVRGLILGDVQSGKTANYTAICNKAADFGYRYIIVLTGITEDLRRQTQERLDLEFVGVDSRINHSDPQCIIQCNHYGVSDFGSDKRIACYTTSYSDFDSRNCRQYGVINQNPVLMVVKKNKSVLNSLCVWFQKNVSNDAQKKISLPLLLVDDEADNASINTSDSDSRPTTINKYIRNLLGLFEKSTYLAVTATPYANIFIDPEREDLFPSDFIYKLSTPSNYIGAESIFSEQAVYGDRVEIIDESEENHPIPLQHKKMYNVGVLPDDMIDAIYYFILINAILKRPNSSTKSLSMLVHVSLYNRVQQSVHDLIEVEINTLKSDLRHYAHSVESDSIARIRRMHAIWDKYELHIISQITWESVLIDLLDVCEEIQVKCINSVDKGRLDYRSDDENGLSVIAVGGNCLSRGLTLEGLCVSYFSRNTQMYDTLLQMGRWFGYRDDCRKYFRIWMPLMVKDNFTRIWQANEELKSDIDRMNRLGKRPIDFCLKVRQDPGSLAVTARNKMRNTQKEKVPISLVGRLIETPKLRLPVDGQDANDAIVKEFIRKLDDIGDRIDVNDERANGNYLWKNVSAFEISALIRDFKAHVLSLGYDNESIVNYIDQYLSSEKWDVVLRSLRTPNHEAGTLSFECGGAELIVNPEMRTISVNGDMIAISKSSVRVGSDQGTRLGLTKQQIESVKRSVRTDDNNHRLTDRDYLSIERPPILFIHAIKPKTKIDECDCTCISADEVRRVPCLFALGIGFPRKDSNEDIFAYYVINRAFLDAIDDGVCDDD